MDLQSLIEFDTAYKNSEMTTAFRINSKVCRMYKFERRCASISLTIIFVTNCLLVSVIRSRMAVPVGAEFTLLPVPRRPMVLSLKYWEQTTNGIKNMFDLQCWASSVHIREVVEPSIFSSASDGNGVLRFDVENTVRFRDYFDIDYWNNLNSNHGYSVLVSIEDFLENANRDLVYVQIKYREKSSPCRTLEEMKGDSWFVFLKRYKFNITTECISVYLSIDHAHFWEEIFGPHHSSPGSKSVMFEEWRGISLQRIFRLQLKNSKCKGLYERSLPKKSGFFKDGNRSSPSFSFLLSNKVLGIVNNFITKYLFGKKYVVLMLRAEKLNSSIFSINLNNNFCIKNILSDYQKSLDIVTDKAVESLFFSDYGAHGSLSWVRRKDWSESAGNFSHYLEQIIQPTYKQDEFEKMLEGVTESKDSVLLSLIQSDIAAKAEALVLVGGGSFQQSIWTKYCDLHKHHKHYLLRNWQCTQWSG